MRSRIISIIVMFATILAGGSAYAVAQENERQDQLAEEAYQVTISGYNKTVANFRKNFGELRELAEDCDSKVSSENSDTCELYDLSLAVIGKIPELSSDASRETFEEQTTVVRNAKLEVLVRDARVSYVRDQIGEAYLEKASTDYETAKKKLVEAIASGRSEFSGSEGEVDDEETRSNLVSILDEADKLLETVPPTVTEDFRKISASFLETVSKISDSVQAVTDSAAARSERIRAEEAAAAVAAVESSNAYSDDDSSGSGSSGGNSSSSGGSSSSGSSGNTWYLNSSGSCSPDNAQSCVDGMSITTIDYSSYGGPLWIGGHNYGAAGVILNFQVGDTVIVSGSGGGTYLVTGERWLSKTEAQAPSLLGTQVAFQTCSDTAMRGVLATRIG